MPRRAAACIISSAKEALRWHTSTKLTCTPASAEHVRFYKDQGYQGIFITDHFFRGNTAIPRFGDWRDRIDAFCAGFEDAWNEGQRIGLDVFFGWEENHQGDEYLIYGLDKQFMLDHPEMERWTRREQYEAVHAAGGCVIQAHPFRMRDYLSAIRVCERYADGVEAGNAGNPPVQDAYTMRYARHKGLYVTAGSDNHRSREESTLFGVALEEKLTSAQDWVQHVLQRKPLTLLCPDDRFDADISNPPELPAFWMDEKDAFVPMDMGWLE